MGWSSAAARRSSEDGRARRRRRRGRASFGDGTRRPCTRRRTKRASTSMAMGSSMARTMVRIGRVERRRRRRPSRDPRERVGERRPTSPRRCRARHRCRRGRTHARGENSRSKLCRTTARTRDATCCASAGRSASFRRTCCIWTDARPRRRRWGTRCPSWSRESVKSRSARTTSSGTTAPSVR